MDTRPRPFDRSGPVVFEKIVSSKSNKKIARIWITSIENPRICPGRCWGRFAPSAVLPLEHGRILCRMVLYESLLDENCASAQEIGEKCAHRRPAAGQNSRFSCFPRRRTSRPRPAWGCEALFLHCSPRGDLNLHQSLSSIGLLSRLPPLSFLSLSLSVSLLSPFPLSLLVSPSSPLALAPRL